MKQKVGYLVLFFLLSVIIAGFIMGLMAGPAIPDYWD